MNKPEISAPKMPVKDAPASQQAIDSIARQKEDLEKLRDILTQPERLQITELKTKFEALEARLNDPARRTDDTIEIIVPTIKARLATDEQLSDALKPVVVEQFHETSRNEPEVMAEALFPIIGPAIRKMITSMFTPDKKSRTITSVSYTHLTLPTKA